MTAPPPSLCDTPHDLAVDTVETCAFCNLPLNDGRPWKFGIDDAPAHNDCLLTHAS